MRRYAVMAVFAIVTPAWLLRSAVRTPWPERWLHVFLALVWCLFVIDVAVVVTSRAAGSRRIWTPAAWLVSAVAIAPQGVPSAAPPPSAMSQIPTQVMSPALAAMVLTRIIDTRREQLRQRCRPAQLTSTQLETLNKVRRVAREVVPSANGDHIAVGDDSVPPYRPVADLMAGVVAVDTSGHDRQVADANLPTDCSLQWETMVCVMGAPMVVNRHGTSAVFRKGRSLELLCWLTLNRNRMRRSTARTAMWDVDISDATFATIVSEMRRGLAEVMPDINRSDICATTYTDEIALHPDIVTDIEILEHVYAAFLADESGGEQSIDALVNALGLVRDIPFSGSPFGWADLDGTTTRVVISVLEAAQSAAQWGMKTHRHDIVRIAVRAGLRVMPGDVGLLDVQRQVLGMVTSCSAEKSLT